MSLGSARKPRSRREGYLPGLGVAGAERAGDGRAGPSCTAVHGTTPLIVSNVPLILPPVTTPESCHVPRDPAIPKEMSSPLRARFVNGVPRPFGAMYAPASAPPASAKRRLPPISRRSVRARNAHSPRSGDEKPGIGTAAASRDREAIAVAEIAARALVE